MDVRITARTLPQALEELGNRDPDIAAAYARVGPPPLRQRPPGFATLMRIILGQQVSVASAKAILERLDMVVNPLTPEPFLALDDDALRSIGFSRQKIVYGRELASALVDGRLDIEKVNRSSDDEVMTELTAIKGIGRWTVEIYLMFVLRRPDVWPAADLGLMQALERLKGLKERPDRRRMEELGETWRPWRSAAALLLWHYLHKTPAE